MRRSLAALLIVLSAICVQLSATSNWASGAAPDGTRYKLSPVGLTLVAPATASGRASACRWWPSGAGEQALCAATPNAERAHSFLRLVYPLLLIGLWLAIVSLFLQVLRRPRGAGLRSAVTWSVTAVTIVAVVALIVAAPRALARLASLPMTFGAAGFVLALLAAVLSAVSGALQLGDADPSELPR